MPRVDAGKYAVDILMIMGFGEREVEKLTDWALSEKVFFLTLPSIVTIEGSHGEKVRYALGIGSIISESKPEVPFFIIANNEWVDGCRVGEKEPEYFLAGGEAHRVSGRIIGLEARNPISMMLNGRESEMVLINNSTNLLPLVILKSGKFSYPIVSIKKGEYMLHATTYNNGKIFKYALTLFTTCPRI